MRKRRSFEFVNCNMCDKVKEGGTVLYTSSLSVVGNMEVEAAICNECLAEIASENKLHSNITPWSGRNLSGSPSGNIHPPKGHLGSRRVDPKMFDNPRVKSNPIR